MNALYETILDVMVKFAALGVITLVGVYTPKLITLIQTRVHSATARSALVFVTTIVSKLVAAEAAHVRDLKDPLKPGTWDRAAASAAMMHVVEQAKAAAPAQMAVIEAGLASGQSLDAVIRQLAEADVEVLRRQTAPVPTTIQPDVKP